MSRQTKKFLKWTVLGLGTLILAVYLIYYFKFTVLPRSEIKSSYKTLNLPASLVNSDQYWLGGTTGFNLLEASFKDFLINHQPNKLFREYSVNQPRDKLYKELKDTLLNQGWHISERPDPNCERNKTFISARNEREKLDISIALEPTPDLQYEDPITCVNPTTSQNVDKVSIYASRIVDGEAYIDLDE